MTDIVQRLIKSDSFTRPIGAEFAACDAIDEIEALRAEIAALRSGDTCARQCEGTAYRLECRTLRARVADLERQNKAARDDWFSWDERREGLEKDAARYRWLRDNYGAHAAYSAAWFNQNDPALFDSDIDAEMKG
jgi:hypothetical protein